MPFANLHVHTMYSMLDGMCKISEIISHAKEIGQSALAITDHGKMHGVIDFYKKCEKAGIKPIIGCEAYVVPDRTIKDASNKDENHLVLLARNQEGYNNLLKIASDAELVGFYYRPRTDWSMLSKHSKGIIALSACIKGEIPQMLLHGEYDRAKELALWYKDLFDEFYLEIIADNTPDQLRMNHLIIELHKDTGIPLVVTNDTHYVFKEDAPIHDVLLAIQTGTTVVDDEQHDKEDTDEEVVEEKSSKGKNKGTQKKPKRRFRFPSPNFWLKSESEIRELLPNYGQYLDQAIENTGKIAEACDVKIVFGKNMLPRFEVPVGHTPDSYLAQLCYAALFKLINGRQGDYDEYYRRLRHELRVISDAGIAGYFLVNQDFVQYAKQNNIMVGPGRGSAAGSLVSYLLGITSIDPMGHKTGIPLMFERFYVEGRGDLPDIDTDFDPNGREAVLDYVRNKHGEARVAHIATFGKMGAKTVIKDVGRALGKSFSLMNEITSYIPSYLEDPETGEKSIEVELADVLEDKDKDGNYTPNAQKLREFQTQEPDLFRIAMRLEGVPRQTGIHAAGIVVSPVDLDNIVPLMRNTNGMHATQFDMNTIAELGLVKYDFLGLKTLSVIKAIVESIKRTCYVDINIDELPLD